MEKAKVGEIIWRDLTVENAEDIRDFYCQVVGWESAAHAMGDYNDYDILSPDGDQPVTGICHARGSNASIPPQWMIYITVADVAASAQTCVDLGGKILDGPRKMGKSDFCIIRDPAGAVAALISG